MTSRRSQSTANVVLQSPVTNRSGLHFDATLLSEFVNTCMEGVALPNDLNIGDPEKFIEALISDADTPAEVRNLTLESAKALANCVEQAEATQELYERAQNCKSGRERLFLMKELKTLWKNGYEMSEKLVSMTKQTVELLRQSQEVKNNNVEDRVQLLQRGRPRGRVKRKLKQTENTDNAVLSTSANAVPSTLANADSSTSVNDVPSASVDASIPSGHEQICICRYPSSGCMLGCDNAGCAIEWFHMVCIHRSRPPNGLWRCAICKAFNHGFGK